ncbi:hypothetical protein C1645_816413 [Glomus cerebriforme]|uniref:Uncharacterized protein n=1 Tax=Glomus cerebriforme TaxID=658196 RepID=A0A397TL88_9GLOM|nr:hypothetical protein C1645_816413 [Glomus cerebriforme]
MSSNRYRCHLSEKELIVTPSSPLQPDHKNYLKLIRVQNNNLPQPDLEGKPWLIPSNLNTAVYIPFDRKHFNYNNNLSTLAHKFGDAYSSRFVTTFSVEGCEKFFHDQHSVKEQNRNKQALIKHQANEKKKARIDKAISEKEEKQCYKSDPSFINTLFVPFLQQIKDEGLDNLFTISNIDFLKNTSGNILIKTLPFLKFI